VSRWTYSYGEKPYTVFAYERPERNHEVWVRYTDLSTLDPTRPTKHKYAYERLGLQVRDPLTGRRNRRCERTAEVEVQRFQGQLVASQRKGNVQSPAVPTTPEQKAEPEVGVALTLARGFELALDTKLGKYASDETRRYDDMVTYRDRLFGVPGGRKALIEPSLTWVELQVRHVRVLWRSLADAYRRSGGKRYGPRVAEQMVDAIYTVASWLREEQRIPTNAALHPPGWRKRLYAEWAERTGEPLQEPARPRHSPEEYRRIFAVLRDPRVDPRIATAIETAAECRTGQVLECWRSMVDLPEIDPATYETAPLGTLGQITIPGAGRKLGETVVFTPDQRRAWDAYLSGQMREYEDAWQRGELRDYPVFPGFHKWRGGAVESWSPRDAERMQPMGRDGARVAFHFVEKIAGVPEIPGRGWYGLRRIASDLAEDETTDDRVKDRLGGWRDSRTRQRIYQDRLTHALRTEAAKVRRAIRSGKPMPDAPSAPVSPVVHLELDAILASLTDEQRAVLLARLLATNQAPTVTTTVTKTPTPISLGKPAIGNPVLATLYRERATGLEPATSSLGSWHSTN
jgi:hypothetical protein